MKLKLIAGLVVITFAFVAWKWSSSRAEASSTISTDSIAVVRRGKLVITVTENGYLKAKNSVNVKPKFKREGKITWLIDEGDTVAEGDLLVEFDSTELVTQISDVENSLIQYEAELQAAQANLEIQSRESTAAIEKAELALEIARLGLERFEKGEAPNERRKKSLEAEKAESSLLRAKERYEQVPDLAAEGFLTKTQVEEERIALREAEINLENAKRELELFDTYSYRMDLTQKESDVKDADRELENSRQKATINLKEKEAQVTQKDRQVTSTRVRLAQLQEELGHMKLTAPQAGTVHYGDPERPWQRENVKIGNQIYQGNTVITLPDLREMQVLIQVHEADIDLVAEGMEVNVTVETHKGTSFKGKVTEIASVASSQSWTDSTNKTFRVDITMEPTDHVMRAGVTAKTEILVEEIPDVLMIPIHAVIAEDGRHFCYVVKHEGFEARDVKIGKSNSHYVAVVDGLADGESVLLYDPRREGQSGGGVPPGGPSNDDDDEALTPAATLAEAGSVP